MGNQIKADIGALHSVDLDGVRSAVVVGNITSGAFDPDPNFPTQTNQFNKLF
jgi:hypothetical protein